MINEPEILLCDEITGELDTTTGDRIVSLLKEINETENMTVAFVTHGPKVSSRSTRIVTIQDGRMTSDRH